MKYLFGILLLVTSTSAWCCSCFGTGRIESAIASHPVLVEGQVVSLDGSFSATLRVTKVLKGSVDSDEISVVHTMCSASLVPSDMEVGHTYVLPLAGPAPEAPAPALNGATAVVEFGPAPGQYEMAVCSHSGLEVINGDLYTFEQDVGRERRLQHYMSYSAFKGWMLVVRGVLAAINFVGALTLALVVGTAGAYFAARYRPWLLVPVLLLATLLCLMNLGDLATRMDSGELGVVYWVLSWIAPAVILGGGTLGYLTRRRIRNAVS